MDPFWKEVSKPKGGVKKEGVGFFQRGRIPGKTKGTGKRVKVS